MSGGNQHIEEPFAFTHSELCQCGICRPGGNEHSEIDQVVNFSCVRYIPTMDHCTDVRHYWEYGLEMSEAMVRLPEQAERQLNAILAEEMAETFSLCFSSVGIEPPTANQILGMFGDIPEPPTTACSDCDVVFPCADAYTSVRDGRIVCETCFKVAEVAGRARERK